MTKQQFFEAFVAALRAQGKTAVVTENDLHHQSFGQALQVLQRARQDGKPESRRLPRALTGDEITGRFPELDSALAMLQFSKYTGAKNPRYRRVELQLDAGTAKEILALYPAPERDLIMDMAKVFTDRGAAIEA